MPNHMHGIILINNAPVSSKGVSHTPLFHPSDNAPEKGVCDTPLPELFRSPSHTIGAIIRGYKSAVTKQINLLDYGDTVWHRNYHEHIIRNEQSYLRISDYIINNPSKWIEDTFYIK